MFFTTLSNTKINLKDHELKQKLYTIIKVPSTIKL